MSPLVEMNNIVKRFPGIVANDHVTFVADRGEIHGLLGENGAGKTTLMNILYGLYRQDSGDVLLEGTPVHIDSPKHALELGIGMVHQHFHSDRIAVIYEGRIVAILSPNAASRREIGLMMAGAHGSDK